MARAAAPTSAQLRALRELRQRRNGDTRGVMLCPAPAASLDEFEAVAVKMQADLMSASSPDRGGDAPKAPNHGAGGLYDVSSNYKPDPARPRP